MMTSRRRRRVKLRGSNSAAKVPHNWFGTGKFTSPAYSVATGEQECDVCKAMIKAKRSEGKVDSKDQVGFCDGMNPSFKEMCTGYSSTYKSARHLFITSVTEMLVAQRNCCLLAQSI